MTHQLVYAARSDRGLIRSSNQDSVYAGNTLLVVADGMGGHAAGDMASRLVVAAFVPLDDRMHQKLIAMAGRPRVWRAVEDAKAQLDRVRFLSLEDPAWLATIHRQHEEIVDRVLAADAEGAVAAMSTHLRAVFASIDTIARSNPEFFRSAPVTPVDRAAHHES
jgi:DNA-binding GntR family transcriptional regulator